MSYTPQTWADGPLGGTPVSAGRLSHMEAGIAAAQPAYASTSVQTANYAAAAGQLVPCDATAGPFTVTLPAGAAAGAQVAVKLLATSGTNTVTVAAAGADVINAVGTTTVVLQLAAESFEFTSNGAGTWFLASGQKSLGSLDARYLRAGAAGGDLGGTLPNPTVVATHLASPLPVAQGGTGSGTQSFVDLTTPQTIAGVKTFGSAPVVPSGAFPESAVTGLATDLAAKYVKPAPGIPATDMTSAVQTSLGLANTALQSAPVTSVGGKTGAVVLVEGDVANLSTDLAAKATDSAVVHLAGPESITGVKTFTAAPVLPAGALPESAVANLGSDLAAKYVKPGTGIPSTDMTSAVQTSLGLAGTALQTAPVTSVNTRTGAVVLGAADVGALTQAAADGRYDALGAATAEGTRAQAAEAANTTAIAAKATPLTTTAVQTSAYAAAANQLVPCDATTAGFAVTLPTAPADKTRLVIKKIDTGANAVTVACGGTDVYNRAAGPTSLTLSLPGQAVTVQYATTGGIWYISADDLPLPQLDGRYLLLAGGTVTGVEYISTVTGVAAPSTFPAGYSASASQTGLALLSSYPSDDIVGGTDGTGRLNLYSYQRANVNSFGETIRNFLMRKDAKAMAAYYVPAGAYDSNRNPVGTTWKPVVWTGAHYESNGHTGNHKHWEIEIPDSTGALQGRFELLFGNQADDTIGLDLTMIATNLANFVVRCHGTDHSGADQKQQLILNAVAGNERGLNYSVTTDATGSRWLLAATADVETGSNAGTNFQVTRYNDSGASIAPLLWAQRSDGQITAGASGANNARMAAVWGTSGMHGFMAKPTSTPGTSGLFSAFCTAVTDRAFLSTLQSDTATRYVEYADGKHEWGDGTNARDTNLYRSAVGTLQTDTNLSVVGSLTTGGAIITPVSEIQPLDLGYTTWSYDPIACRSSQILTSGVLYLIRIQIKQATTVHNVFLGIVTAGSGLTANQNFVGLYSSVGTLVASTADQAVSWATGTSEKQAAFVSPVAVTPGFYWVGILANGTTVPTVACGEQVASNLGSGAAGASARRFGSFGSAQVALPSTITPSSMGAVTSQTYWVAVN